jgi:endonuclease/exonuclease/phosphatase family metal-dependent hydrolase
VANAVREQAPDVVALQEVDVHWSERSGFADQATQLAAALKMEVRFAHIYRLAPREAGQPPREFGVALLSRHRIVSWSNDSLTRLSTQDANAVPARMPGLLRATFDVNGCRLRILTTHLDYRADPSVRRQQVAEIVGYVGELADPTIVAGDLNAPPDASELAPLLRVFRDAWSAASSIGRTGDGLTYPAEVPAKRIDYVLVSPHFIVQSATVPLARASDHRPVIADVRLDRGTCGRIHD